MQAGPWSALRLALGRDLALLASLGVMDYSALVVEDEEESGQLVVAVIDYLRQYTWDKHLETWAKTAVGQISRSTHKGKGGVGGEMGGGEGAPTVVDPGTYARRFRAAMEAYVGIVPEGESGSGWERGRDDLAGDVVARRGGGGGGGRRGRGEEDIEREIDTDMKVDVE